LVVWYFDWYDKNLNGIWRTVIKTKMFIWIVQDYNSRNHEFLEFVLFFGIGIETGVLNLRKNFGYDKLYLEFLKEKKKKDFEKIWWILNLEINI
jgi:hypothetical protein